jgi:hypothetical protein
MNARGMQMLGSWGLGLGIGIGIGSEVGSGMRKMFAGFEAIKSIALIALFALFALFEAIALSLSFTDGN